MKNIFVNLKRFDVPKAYGGICQMDDPKAWIRWVIEECVEKGLGKMENVKVTFLLPESLIITARERLADYPVGETGGINVGCQGVFREDVALGGNFGAFTTNRPASAAKAIGCTWVIIGHSEERKDKLDVIERFEPACRQDERLWLKAMKAVNGIIADEVRCSLKVGLNVLLCVGETEEERGHGEFEQQKPRIREVLKTQLEQSLRFISANEAQGHMVIGYEPVWAIGPGKVPPDAEYISFVSAYIKSVVEVMLGFEPPVVYGGGLKEENAAMIAGIDTIDGGLVALTRFTGDIAFEPKGLKAIIDKYIQ
ncbi:MAG: triosephosphate isomerase [Clostridiales bacterium]|jgi:triosephosphate isomerase|nr:triosephosphate isomerase [Clostridiales bacterium]